MATRIEWEALVAGEAHALGDVLVQGEVLVARGRVLDSSGDPIRGAEVELGWGLDFFLEEGTGKVYLNDVEDTNSII